MYYSKIKKLVINDGIRVLNEEELKTIIGSSYSGNYSGNCCFGINKAENICTDDLNLAESFSNREGWEYGEWFCNTERTRSSCHGRDISACDTMYT